MRWPPRAVRPGWPLCWWATIRPREIYVRNKIKTCHDLGIYSESITPPDSISTEELLAIVEGLNARAGYRRHPGATAAAAAGGHQANSAGGRAGQGRGRLPSRAMSARWWPGCPAPRACTPAGIIELLKRGGIPIAGQRAVVVGRSDIVGKPVAMLLLHEHATVTICHSKTPDLPAVCREADILVAAIGRRRHDHAAISSARGRRSSMWAPTHLKDREEAARIFRNSAEKLASFDKRGSVLVGDVDPIDVVERAGGVHAGAGRRGAADHRHADGRIRWLRPSAAPGVC